METLEQLSTIPLLRGLDPGVLSLLADRATAQDFEPKHRIIEQHDEARWVYFLLSGTVQFLIRVEGVEDLLVGATSEAGALVGWSAFRPPYRYTSTVRCQSACRLLRVERDAFDDLFAVTPQAGIRILRAVAHAMAERMEQARDRLTAPSAREYALDAEHFATGFGGNRLAASAPVQGVTRAPDPITLLSGSPFFETFDAEAIAALAAAARWRDVTSGERVLEQGECAERLYVVASGAYRLGARGRCDAAEGGTHDRLLPIRTLGRPGDTLGWSSMVPPYRYRVTAVATTPGRLLVLERRALDALSERNAVFGIELLKRVLWMLGNRLRVLRVRLIASRYDREVVAVRALLDQNAELLPVTSPLLKVPLFLEHRLTLADAFQCLDLVKAHGGETERQVAGLCLEILEDVHEELLFFKGLQNVYEHVAHAPASAKPSVLRLRCSREFMTMFDRLDYTVVGWERLPSRPGHIFIMNHLCSHPDNALPNDFHLILDTHFVSSVILHRHYGQPPRRVVREAYPNEFMQKAYYERLGYIMVPANAESGGGNRERAAGEARGKLLEEAGALLAAGENLVICPEGTCGPSQSSPLPFKTGAFALAAQTRPEPLIVPIALANFDEKVTRSRMAAVIGEPLRLSRALPGQIGRDRLRAFVDEYRLRFSDYVAQARRLCEYAEPSARERRQRRGL